MPEHDLLVIGDLNPDLIVSGNDVRPSFGQIEKIVDSAILTIGGSGAITAVGASRLGLSVALCAVVGIDAQGEMVRAQVESEGVNTDAVRSHPEVPTGLTVVLCEDDDRAMLTALGTIQSLNPADLAELPDAPARHVHVSSYYLMSASFRTSLPHHLARFKAAGCSVSLDTNWDPAERWELSDVFESVDVFLPNEKELWAITGVNNTADALMAMAESVSHVVVKRGEDGAAATSGKSIVWCDADSSEAFVDAIGAGDSFDAGFIAAVANGQSVADALRLAVVVGTMSTLGVGGTSSQPTFDEAIRRASNLNSRSTDDQ